AHRRDLRPPPIDRYRGKPARTSARAAAEEGSADTTVERRYPARRRRPTGFRPRGSLGGRRPAPSTGWHRGVLDVMGSSAIGGARWTRSVENPPEHPSHRPGVTG